MATRAKAKKNGESAPSSVSKISVGTTKIYKEFPPKGFFQGTILKWVSPYYKVRYEDGDEEELEEKEILPLLDKPKGYKKLTKEYKKIGDSLKDKVVRYALEVVPGGKGKGGTRGASEAARAYGISRQTVTIWIDKSNHMVHTHKLDKSQMTDSLKEKVVRYALEVVPGGKGKGGTRGAYEAARAYGISHANTVTRWIGNSKQTHKLDKSQMTDSLKEEVVSYALGVVPGGKGKGGIRGAPEAARAYGIPQATVRVWIDKSKQTRKLDKSKILKEEVVCYALEVVPGGKGKGGTRGTCEAARAYGIPQTTIYHWIGKSRKAHKLDKSQITENLKEGPSHLVGKGCAMPFSDQNFNPLKTMSQARKKKLEKGLEDLAYQSQQRDFAMMSQSFRADKSAKAVTELRQQKSKGSKAQLQYEEEDEDRFLQGQTIKAIRSQTINAIRRLHAENRITLEQKRKLLSDIIQHASSDETSNTEMAYELLMSDNEDWSNEGFVDEFADQCRAIADRMAQ